MVHPIPNSGFSVTYIIEGERDLAVVDPGSVGSADDAKAWIENQLHRRIEDVSIILATHFHIDHIGGIGRLLSFTGADTKVLFHERVRDYLEGRRPLSVMRNWYLGLRPTAWKSAASLRRLSHLVFDSLAGIPLPGFRGFNRLPYGTDRIAFYGHTDDKKFPVGFETWEVIETPGHTEDSVSFFCEGTGDLLCGDLIVNMERGGKGRLNRFYSSAEEIVASFEFLKRTVKVKTIYPGHGRPVHDEHDALAGVEQFVAK